MHGKMHDVQRFDVSKCHVFLFAGVKGAVEVAIVADICKKYKGPIV
jgi:hypothetical protein